MSAGFRAFLTVQRWHALVALTLFSTIVFAKLWTIRLYGSDLPYWDQWDSEWTLLLLPWQRGELSWMNFYVPHNEHRIVLTKALSLAGVYLNGQWDVRLQLCVNALLHAGIALGLFLWLARSFRESPLSVVLWALALLIGFAPPHSMENTLSGFHSQQYFLIGLSLLGIERTLRCRPWSVGWWMGIAAMVLALFTMASGLLAAASVIVAVLFFSGFSLQHLRIHAPTLVCCTLICAGGVAMKVDVPHHEFLHAHSLRDFFGVIVGFLTWPAVGFPALAALNVSPAVVLVVDVYKRRLPMESKEVALIASGIWVLFQIAATAYARAGQGVLPASRYVDTLVLGLIFSFSSGLLALARRDRPRALKIALLAGLVLWSAVVGRGLIVHTQALFAFHLPLRIKNLRQCEQNVRLYLATGDAAHLKESDIPYPGIEEIKERLSHREIDPLLPSSVRRPVEMVAETSDGFDPQMTSPQTPLFEAAENFGSFPETRTGTWISGPIAPPRAAFLKFEMAGDTGDPGIALELWSTASSTKLASVAPSKVPNDTWRAAYVPTPREPFRIVARDTSQTAWMAFTAPLAMASGSYWCWRLTEHAPLLFWLSIASFVGCAGIGFLVNLRRTSSAPAPIPSAIP